jgi:hypothetical protein
MWKQTAVATYSRWFLAREFFYPENEGDIFLPNAASHEIYTAPHPRTQTFFVTKHVHQISSDFIDLNAFLCSRYFLLTIIPANVLASNPEAPIFQASL